jgi:ElaB/YqjD/DUF883 family membrane-anchored ribosome-binding protein
MQQQPPELNPDPMAGLVAELSKRLDRIEAHQREDAQALRQRIEDGLENVNQRIDVVNQRIDALNGRVLWVIGTQIALTGLLLAALKLT